MIILILSFIGAVIAIAIAWILFLVAFSLIAAPFILLGNFFGSTVRRIESFYASKKL